mgnify:FL=1|tara:strand:+ start:21034 stop:21414 length:381 start_codon:yes stop_codon:yes gene_type:complete
MEARVLELARRFLEPFCPRIQLHLTQIIRILPGQGQQPLHRDRLAWGGYLPCAIEPQFNTMWALTDFTEENGATQVVPGPAIGMRRVEPGATRLCKPPCRLGVCCCIPAQSFMAVERIAPTRQGWA